MRIIYDNLIDNLNASTLTALTTATGYTILDVQDQRLTTQWMSSSATSQTITIELPTLSEYPDSSSSTYYLQNTWATVDSFTANNCIISVANGMLHGVVATAGDPYITRFQTFQGSTYSVIKIKHRYSRDDASNSIKVYYSTASHGISESYYKEVATTPTVADEWYITTLNMSSLDVGGTDWISTAISSIRFDLMNLSSLGNPTFDIDWIYIGTGAYTTQLEDLSGNGNHGTIYGATPVEGDVGKALSFDGVNDYIGVSLSYVNTSSFSFSCRAKKNADSGFGTFYSDYDTGINNNIRIGPGGNPNELQFIVGSGSTTAVSCITTGSKFVDDEWAHWVFVYSGGEYIRIYKNGEQVAESTTTIPTTIAAAHATQYIGKWSVFEYSGALEDIRIYRRALSADETVHLTNSERFVSENYGLIARYDIDHGLGINTAAILGHNILQGTQVKIQGHDSDVWGDPDINEIISNNENIMLNFFSDTYYKRFWHFTFSGQGSISIGRLWLGEYLTINPSSLLDFRVIKKRSDVVIYGKDRQKWSSEGVGWRQFEMNFPDSDEEMIYLVKLFRDAVRNHSSFIFCNFDTIRDYTLVEPCYVSLNGDLIYNHTGRMKFTYSLSMEEEK